MAAATARRRAAGLAADGDDAAGHACGSVARAAGGRDVPAASWPDRASSGQSLLLRAARRGRYRPRSHSDWACVRQRCSEQVLSAHAGGACRVRPASRACWAVTSASVAGQRAGMRCVYKAGGAGWPLDALPTNTNKHTHTHTHAHTRPRHQHRPPNTVCLPVARSMAGG
jgi:hypothetical protein